MTKSASFFFVYVGRDRLDLFIKDESFGFHLRRGVKFVDPQLYYGSVGWLWERRGRPSSNMDGAWPRPSAPPPDPGRVTVNLLKSKFRFKLQAPMYLPVTH